MDVLVTSNDRVDQLVQYSNNNFPKMKIKIVVITNQLSNSGIRTYSFTNRHKTTR